VLQLIMVSPPGACTSRQAAQPADGTSFVASADVKRWILLSTPVLHRSRDRCAPPPIPNFGRRLSSRMHALEVIMVDSNPHPASPTDPNPPHRLCHSRRRTSSPLRLQLTIIPDSAAECSDPWVLHSEAVDNFPLSPSQRPAFTMIHCAGWTSAQRPSRIVSRSARLVASRGDTNIVSSWGGGGACAPLKKQKS